MKKLSGGANITMKVSKGKKRFPQKRGKEMIN
jgi:hypothetical protein